MTSQEEQAFMAAILASPDDDTPRLVFADWLDERATGDDAARAALIRAQCRAETLPRSSKERGKLEREAKVILRANQARWTAPLAALRLGIKDETFRRGFLDGITVSANTFARCAADIFKAVPTIRAARFPDASNELEGVTRSPYLPRLASVDLTRMCVCGYCPIDRELSTFFKSKKAAGLKSLNVSLDRIDAEVVEVLARSTALANLMELDLRLNPLGPEGAAVLAQARHLTRLVRLDLAGTDIGDAGTAALAGAKHFPSLAHLVLNVCRIGPTGVRALAASPLFKQLRTLDLSGNRIGEAGAKALAAAAGERLESLDLSGTQLGPRAQHLLREKLGKKVLLD